MRRDYDAQGFRRIPGDGKYQGATALRVSADRDIMMAGTGVEVEAALRASVLSRLSAQGEG